MDFLSVLPSDVPAMAIVVIHGEVQVRAREQGV